MSYNEPNIDHLALLMDTKNSLVVKDNALINASYSLNLAEQRLILLAIVEAREELITAESELSIHASSYAKRFNVTPQAAYQALQEACRNLFDRQFSFHRKTSKGQTEIVLSRWVQYVTYDETATVRIAFTKPVIPLITSLEEHFTSYELRQISGLSSPYAIRLYELLISWRAVGKTPVYELDVFRARLGVEPHEYSQMNNFKRRVLDPSIKQINENTDITANYEQHKKGRSISGFSFSFKTKQEVSSKPSAKRQTITREEAAKKARPGEDWKELVKRLSRTHVVTGL